MRWIAPLLALLVVGCSEPAPEEPSDLIPEDPSETLPSEPVSYGSTEALAEPDDARADAIARSNELTLDLLSGASETENLAVSGWGVQALLGLVSGLMVDPEHPALGPATTRDEVAALQRTIPEDERLGTTVGNAVFFRHELPAGYAESAREDYRAEVDALRDVDQVNDWVSEATKGRIPVLFEELSPEVTLVAVNAFTFDGLWDVPFDADLTEDRPFAAPSGTRDVPFMSRDGLSGYEGEGFVAASIPYVGFGARMMVLLPEDGRSIDETLTSLGDDWAESYGSREVNLKMPRFEIESTLDLTRRVPVNLIPPFAVVNQFVQKGYVKVDEEGTEAAFATGLEAEASDEEPEEPIELVLDRPFLFFVIADGPSPLILFSGIVREP